MTKIGKITLQWNDLHLFIFSIFWHLNSGNASRSSAIFFAVQADRTQRNMTAALVQLELSPVPLLRDATIDLLNEIGKMSGRRNDIIHSMWIFEADFEKGVATVFEPSSPRLSKKRLGEELDKLYEDLVQLGVRLSSISNKIIEFCELRANFAAKRLAERPAPPHVEEPNSTERSPPDTAQAE